MRKLTPEEKIRATDDLKKLLGLSPYDTMDNPCYGDGYFAKSLEERYGVTIDELKKETGLK